MKAERERQGLSLSDIADLAKIPIATAEMIETEPAKVALCDLYAFASALGQRAKLIVMLSLVGPNGNE